MDIAAAVNQIFRYELARAIEKEPGIAPLADAARDLLNAAPAEGEEEVPAEERPLDAFGKKLSPRLGPEDLKPPKRAGQTLLEHLLEGGEPVGEGVEPSDETTPPPETPAGPDETATPPGPPPPPAALPIPPAFRSPYLELRLLKVTAQQVTEPRWKADDFALTGGYTYASGHGKLRNWRKKFADGEAGTCQAA
jgi:hypothetical protein